MQAPSAFLGLLGVALVVGMLPSAIAGPQLIADRQTLAGPQMMTPEGPVPVPEIAPVSTQDRVQQIFANLLQDSQQDVVQHADAEQHAKDLGFSSLPGVADSLTLSTDTPFAVYFVSLTTLRNLPPVVDVGKIRTLLGKSTRLLYPVKVGGGSGEVKSSLTLDLDHPPNQWRVAEVGSAPLIRMLTAHGNGSTNFIVWIPSLYRHYLGSIHNNGIMFKAIRDHRIGRKPPIEFHAGESLPAQTVLLKLHEEAMVPWKGTR